jgi:hypothetical protein
MPSAYALCRLPVYQLRLRTVIAACGINAELNAIKSEIVDDLTLVLVD